MSDQAYMHEINRLEGERDYWKRQADKYRAELDRTKSELAGYKRAYDTCAQVVAAELEAEVLNLRPDHEAMELLRANHWDLRYWDGAEWEVSLDQPPKHEILAYDDDPAEAVRKAKGGEECKS